MNHGYGYDYDFDDNMAHYDGSDACANKVRKINKMPFKVLDAPQL